jgi:4-hydroxy-tetrahydrodipicolinate reductase
MIKLCVAGATGRMGSTLIHEALKGNFEIVGAIVSPNNPNRGKTLQEIGLIQSDVKLLDPSNIKDAVENADVYVSFTTPEAECSNILIVADLGKRIVLGTTGIPEERLTELKAETSLKVPAVFSPNFAIGINIIYKLIQNFKTLPKEYELSIVEAHHSGKKDAPSGTAKAMADIVSELREYKKIVHGRSGVSLREPDEIEVVSLRAGGIPGIHKLIAAGPHELISIEHVSFSRSVFAQGTLYAVEWIYKQSKPGVYSMNDVLGN